MKRIFALLLVVGFMVCCENKDLGVSCYHGKAIMSSCCSGTTFVNILSLAPIGKPAKLNGQTYPNVIQVPGYIATGDVYLTLRKFDPNKDYALIPPHCYCLVAITDAPMFVVTASSATSCPDIVTIN